MADKPIPALFWIDQALAISPTAMRLAAYQKKLEKLGAQNRFEHLLSDSRNVIEQSAELWSTELAAAPAGLQEQGDLLALIRGLLEAMQQGDVPAPAWPALRNFAVELLGDSFQVELIRDPKQPAEWFDAPIEADTSEPRLERAGLAIRAANQAWFCFPKGRFLAPLPQKRTRREEAGEAIHQLVLSTPWLKRLRSPAEALVEASRSAELPNEKLVFWFLDRLTEIEPTSENQATRDLVLEQVRGWCSECGWEILPRQSNFRDSFVIDQVPTEEGQAVFQFHPGIPRGQIIGVIRFGLAQGPKLFRPCELSVSVGLEPVGFGDLKALISNRELIGSDLLRVRLVSWPEAAMNGTLEMAAVQFFVDVWGVLGEELRNCHPESAQELSSLLGTVLRQNWKLYPFYPTAYQDHPDGWLQRVPGRNMVTGRVRRVLRPGLQDEEGHLRVPALVEVE